jgi:hypothetical protein
MWQFETIIGFNVGIQGKKNYNKDFKNCILSV